MADMTDPQARLQQLLMSANPDTYKGAKPPTPADEVDCVFMARRASNGGVFWHVLGIYPTRFMAEAELKKPNNFDEDSSQPTIDNDHLVKVNVGTSDTNTVKLIINAMKRMINSNCQTFTASEITDVIEDY